MRIIAILEEFENVYLLEWNTGEYSTHISNDYGRTFISGNYFNSYEDALVDFNNRI